MFKTYVRDQFRRLFRRMQSVEDRTSNIEGRERASQMCHVHDFETGLLLMRAAAKAVPVYGEHRLQLFTTGLIHEKRWSVNLPPTSGMGYPASGERRMSFSDTAAAPSVPSDLQKYLMIIQPGLYSGTVRWYPISDAPQCDFIDASGPKDRFVTLVGKESKK